MAIAAGLLESWVVEATGAGVAGADGAGFAVAVIWVVPWLAVGGRRRRPRRAPPEPRIKLMGGSRGSIMDEGPCPRPPRLERLHRKGEHRCTTEGAVSVEIPTLSSAASLSGCSLERLRSGQSAPSASRSRGGVLAASCSTWNGSYLIRVCWESASQPRAELRLHRCETGRARGEPGPAATAARLTSPSCRALTPRGRGHSPSDHAALTTPTSLARPRPSSEIVSSPLHLRGRHLPAARRRPAGPLPSRARAWARGHGDRLSRP